MTAEAQIKAADDCLAKLTEFFPDVQLLASWHDEEGTHDIFIGKGSWYARIGMAHEFLTRDEGQTAAHEIAKELRD